MSEPRPTSPVEDPRLQRFDRDFRKLLHSGKQFTLTLNPLEAWSLMSAVQLAARHPGFSGQVALHATRAARRLQAAISLTPILAEIAEEGWNSHQDLED